jgi:hypothetical protein
MFDWIYVGAAWGSIDFADIVIIKIISDDVLSGITLHKNKILINNICSWDHLTFSNLINVGTFELLGHHCEEKQGPCECLLLFHTTPLWIHHQKGRFHALYLT